MRGIQTLRLFACAAIAVAACLNVWPSSKAMAQTQFSVVASLDQLPTREGDPVYRVNVTLTPSPLTPDAEVASLIAPDGTAGTELPTGTFRVLREDVSLSAAQSTFPGTWAFTERRGDEFLEYEFTLPEITPDLFPETPTILSPMDGDTVGTEFLLDWEYESGAEPSGFSLTGRLGEGIRTFNTDRIDPTSLNMVLGVDPGFSEGDLTLRIGNSDSQDIDIIPVTPGADATFFFRFVQVESLSLPINITARIPEPSTILLLGTAVPLLITRRRRPVT